MALVGNVKQPTSEGKRGPVARSALRGHVDSCSRVFIASVAWKNSPDSSDASAPEAKKRNAAYAMYKKMEDGYGSGVPDGHMALLWHGTER